MVAWSRGDGNPTGLFFVCWKGMLYCRTTLLACWLLVAFSLQAQAQDATLDVQPVPLIRLTGVLDVTAEPRTSSAPVLKVWIGDKPALFRVARVEPVIPAYPAEERLRTVSSWGLRLLAEKAILATLQSEAMHDRPIVIEGWLRVKPGLLQVRSVRLAEEPR